MKPTQLIFRRVVWAFGAIVILAGLLSGCAMVGSNYQRPSVEVNQNWLETKDPGLQSDYQDYRTWWKAFNDPTWTGSLRPPAGDGRDSELTPGVMLSRSLECWR